MVMNSLACPVCGYHQFREAFTVRDFFVSGEDFPVKSCQKCGMLITLSLPGRDEMGRYYKSDDYISHSDTKQGMINRIYHIVRNIMLDRKLKIIQKESGKKSGNLLDIGTGTGYFLNHMKKNGWTINGTEKEESARKFAQEQWGIEVLPEDSLFSLHPAKYDVITLWHVMEHLPYPDQHWQIISKLLRPDGLLLVALPNAASYDAGHYGRFWAAWDVPRHLWHFSPKHISELGRKHGFSLKRVKRMPFDAFYISILSEKYKGSGIPVIKGIFRGKLSWMVSLIYPEKCSSLIYIFKKNV